MAIETLDDIVEGIADGLGIYGEKRSYFVSELTRRIKQAIEVERKLREAPHGTGE